MARRPRRSAKRLTPRPDPFVAFAKRIEADPAWPARKAAILDRLGQAAEEIRQRVDAGHELWQAATGEPMPLELDEIRAAAYRFGLSSDAVLAGDFTLGDVTTLMAGNRLAAADAVHDRVRIAEAEAAVRLAAGIVTPGTPPPADTKAEAADDDYAGIARRLSDKACRTLAYMHEMNAVSRGDKLTRQFLADALGLEIDDMRVVRTELGKVGKKLLETVDGCRGGWWLTPDGGRVAKRVAASRPGSNAAKGIAKRA